MCRSRTTACPVLNGTTGNRMMDRGGLTAGETISSRGSPTESQPAAEASHWEKLKRDSVLFKINY